jgi:serine/threonine protein kinase
MSTSRNSLEKCPRCGIGQLDAELDGLCASCLLSLAVSEPDQANGAVEPANVAANFAPIPLENKVTTPHSLAPLSSEGTPDIERIRDLFPELEIERKLGQGGMGIVFLAHQKHLNRPVALKIIAPEIAGDPTFSERFSREARTTQGLTHGNVAMVFDFGEVAGLYFMIMEFAEGRSLRELISDGGMSTFTAVNMVLQVCDALDYAHHAGVVHRDIKPENIIVGPSRHVKVVDFGLAKLMDPA